MNNLKKKKALIFDFDGTVVDSMTRLIDVAGLVIAKYFGISNEEAKRLYRLTSGLPFNEQLAGLYPAHPNRDEAANEFETTKVETYFEEPLFSDALETLFDLKSKNYFLAVSSSNYQHLVEAFVAKKKLPFDLALGWKPNFGKGAPHFQFIQEETRLARDEMIFIGDSLKDGERAFNFGVDFIGKAGTFTPEQFSEAFPGLNTIKNLAELKTIF